MRFRKTKKFACALTLAFGILTTGNVYGETQASMTLTYDGQTHQYHALPISLYINNVELSDLPMMPIIYNDYTLVPAREVFESLGAVVDWKEDSEEVYIGYHDNLIILQVDNQLANVNGSYNQMSVPPKIINGKTMIPIRFPSESLGFVVEWIEEERAAYISTDTMPVTIEESVIGPVENDAPTIPVQNLPTNTPVPTPAPTSPPVPASTPVNQTSVGGTVGLAKDVSVSTIAEESNPETKITNIGLPENNGTKAFSIEASSAISKVEKILLPDNRLAIDIYNAEMSLPKSEFTVANSVISRMWAAQNQVTPVKITRVVFELKGATEFSIDIATDRKKILVSFQNTITDVTFKTDSTGDYVYIQFQNEPLVNAFSLANPDRIVIDAPMSDINRVFEQAEQGRFVSAMRTAQFDANTARIVLDLKGIATYTVTREGNQAIIKLTEPTYRNIWYNGEARALRIAKNGNTAFQIGSFMHNDQYNALKYTINLQADYSGLLGYGEYHIGDSFMSSVLLQNNSMGQTEIVFNEKQILAYDVTEDAQYVYIKAMNPKEKYSRIIILDAGHGGHDNGTSGNGIIEKNINYNIVNKAIALIEQDQTMKVYSTRTSDVKIELEDRVRFANNLGDLFVSVHVNSATPNTKANGTEVYYYPHENDSTIGISSLEVATILHQHLLAELGSTDRKVKSETYIVIKNTKIPAALLEVGFVSNPEEAAKLGSDEYRQKTAVAIYKGIIKVFEKYTPKR